jgi:toxin FitB
MAWLVDTNILSEGRKPKPEPRVTAFYNAQPLDQLYISVVSIAEIRFGIELQQDPARRAELHNWLTLTLRPTFAGRILPVTEDILFKWRLLLENGRKIGHTYSTLIFYSQRPLSITASLSLRVIEQISTTPKCQYSTHGSSKPLLNVA